MHIEASQVPEGVMRQMEEGVRDLLHKHGAHEAEDRRVWCADNECDETSYLCHVWVDKSEDETLAMSDEWYDQLNKMNNMAPPGYSLHVEFMPVDED